jgi:hypothetical protein
MRDKKKDPTALWLVPMVILMLIGMLAGSCRSIQYVPVETVKYEYITRDSIQLDSVYVKDSILIRQNSDTVFLDKYRYVYKYKYIDKIDTVLRVDSVAVPYPVEKKLTRWQQMKMDFGAMATGILALLLGITVFYIFVKSK